MGKLATSGHIDLMLTGFMKPVGDMVLDKLGEIIFTIPYGDTKDTRRPVFIRIYSL